MEGKGAADIFSQRFTTDEIRDMYKNYPLCEIYKALGFDLDGHLVGIMMPEVIGCIDAQYTDENLDKRETFAETTLLQAPMTGIDTLPPDEVYAMKTITALVPSLVDEVYVEYCFDKSIKPQIYDLTVMMIDAFREMLQEEDWLSDATKAAAIEKLDNIKINVCYPDNLPDVGSLTIKSAEEGGTLFDAIKAARIFGRSIVAEIVQRRNDGTYWKFDNYYSNLGACYVPTENSINVFAGICGGDFYQADWPLEKKLGGVCMVVGHEITHAFDDLGATFDKRARALCRALRRGRCGSDQRRGHFRPRLPQVPALYRGQAGELRLRDVLHPACHYSEERALRRRGASHARQRDAPGGILPLQRPPVELREVP